MTSDTINPGAAAAAVAVTLGARTVQDVADDIDRSKSVAHAHLNHAHALDLVRWGRPKPGTLHPALAFVVFTDPAGAPTLTPRDSEQGDNPR